MRLAVTADLHWGLSIRGDYATEELADRVAELAPDAFIIAGDVGEGPQFVRCLQVFEGLPCARLLVPGNHDLWTHAPAPSSLKRYREELPELCRQFGFRYLDEAPYLSPDGSEAVVGSINWYDYSFADPALAARYADVAALYRAKRFPKGRHMDGEYVRLGITDEEFTAELVSQFRAQLSELPTTVQRVTVVQHHPPLQPLFYPSALTSDDQKFWLAYTGNRSMERAVSDDPRVSRVLCGHTHAAVYADWCGKRCWNVGGDYQWKRMLHLDTDTGEVLSFEFGSSEG